MKTVLLRRRPRAYVRAKLLLAALLSGMSLAATPVQAAPKSQTYTVTLAIPLTEAKREIIDGAIWRCNGNRCAAPADGERLLPLCSRVARKFGAIAGFVAPHSELTVDELARCNRR